MYEEHLYRKELYETMGRDDELVDTVKLHLREKIINKLRTNQPPKQAGVDMGFLKKVCNSLFIDYLTLNRYFHTASVFAPESLSTRSQFSNEELKSLFRLTTKQNQSMLEAVLELVMPKGRIHEKTNDCSVQTDDRETMQHLETKLNNIQFEYRQKQAMGLRSVEESEQRFLKYKNEQNKKYKQQLQAEITRIRDYELANIRMEEQQKSRAKIREYQEELDASYSNKLEKLREREAEVIQRVASKMKNVQTYNYTSRQAMLRDLQAIKAREQQLERAEKLLEERQRLLHKPQP